jgi:hypothetical protein
MSKYIYDKPLWSIHKFDIDHGIYVEPLITRENPWKSVKTGQNLWSPLVFTNHSHLTGQSPIYDTKRYNFDRPLTTFIFQDRQIPPYPHLLSYYSYHNFKDCLMRIRKWYMAKSSNDINSKWILAISGQNPTNYNPPTLTRRPATANLIIFLFAP